MTELGVAGYGGGRFLRSLFSLFAVPYRVAQEMKQANAPIKEVTPQLLRRRLKDGVQQTDRPLTAHEVSKTQQDATAPASLLAGLCLTHWHVCLQIEAVPGLALDLLCFCLADAGLQEVSAFRPARDISLGCES